MATLVATIVGDNEPGIIHAIAECASNANANWLESHLANLAGKFAGVVEFELAADRVDSLKAALEALSSGGLQVVVLEGSSASTRSEGQRKVSLELTGQDHPGIVRDISAALHEVGISIEKFDTVREDASMAGGQLFTAKARLLVPNDVSTDTMNRTLEDLSHEMTVDITLSRQF
ncbi:MAG: glycine cleavage system protein R [Gammaproteobacteria bacterium]|nr:MAG: glycine cleavage system protein R [Gammaproteobacteria bacterium]